MALKAYACELMGSKPAWGTDRQPTRDFEPVKSLPKMKLGLVTEWDSAKIPRFQTPKKTVVLRNQIGWFRRIAARLAEFSAVSREWSACIVSIEPFCTTGYSSGRT